MPDVNKPNKIKTTYWWLPLFVAVSSTLGLALVLTLWAHPIGDDFCRVTHVREMNLLDCVKREFLTWSGRWSGIGLAYVVSSIFDITKHYSICLLVAASFYGFACYIMVTALFRHTISRRLSCGFVGTLFALYWAGMKHPGETVYWLTGAYENHLSIAFSMIIFGGILKLHMPPTFGSRIWLGGLLFLTFATMGMHELFGAMTCAALSIGAIVALFYRHPRRYIWASVAISACVGFIIVYLAPGNADRMEEFSRYGKLVYSRPDLQRAIFIAIWNSPKVLLTWIADPVLLAATAIFIGFFLNSETAPTLKNISQIPLCIIIPSAWLGIMVMAFFGLSLTKDVWWPARTQNGLYMFFLLGWFLSVFIILQTRKEKYTISLTSNNWWIFGLSIIFAAGIFRADNTINAIVDIRRGTLTTYHHQMLQQKKIIQNSVSLGLTTVEVPRINNWPKSYMEGGITDDSRHWKNWCKGKYFGLMELKQSQP